MKNDKLNEILLLIVITLICSTLLESSIHLNYAGEIKDPAIKHHIFHFLSFFFIYSFCVSFTPYSVRHCLKNCFLIQKLKIAHVPLTRQPS